MDTDQSFADPQSLAALQANALEKLKNLQAKAKRIKDEHRSDRVEAATALLDRMQAESPDELRRVLQRYVDIDR